MSQSKTNVVPIKSTDSMLDVIIPCAGIGYRMKAHGPKCMIEINGKTILETQIGLIKKRFKHCNIIVVGGYAVEKIKAIKRLSAKIVINENYETTNVVGSIACAMSSCVSNRLLVVNGDVVFNANAIKLPLANQSVLLVDNSGYMHQREVGVSSHHYVEQIIYGLPEKWGQIAYFVEGELERFKELVTIKNNHNKFTFEIINQIIDKGGRFLSYSPKGMAVADIDVNKDIEVAESI